MTVQVKVKAHARRNTVDVLPDGTLVVRVSEPALEGRANARVCELLAGHYGVPKSDVRIKRGHRSSQKLIEILTT